VPIGERAAAWLRKYIAEARPQLAIEPDDFTRSLQQTRTVQPRPSDLRGQGTHRRGEVWQVRGLPSASPLHGDHMHENGPTSVLSSRSSDTRHQDHADLYAGGAQGLQQVYAATHPRRSSSQRKRHRCQQPRASSLAIHRRRTGGGARKRRGRRPRRDRRLAAESVPSEPRKGPVTARSKLCESVRLKPCETIKNPSPLAVVFTAKEERTMPESVSDPGAYPGGIRCPSSPLKSYNRSHMQPAFSTRIPDGLLPQCGLEAKNRIRGFRAEIRPCIRGRLSATPRPH